jgi:hypothetical protein
LNIFSPKKKFQVWLCLKVKFMLINFFTDFLHLNLFFNEILTEQQA